MRCICYITSLKFELVVNIFDLDLTHTYIYLYLKISFIYIHEDTMHRKNGELCDGDCEKREQRNSHKMKTQTKCCIQGNIMVKKF